MEYAALAGKKVIAYSDSSHGLEMSFDYSAGDVMGCFMFRIFALLYFLKNFGSFCLCLGIALKIRRDSRIKIPAIIIKFFLNFFNLGQALLLELHKAEDNICHLDPSVVYVILDFDVFSLVFQAAPQGITETSVP